MKWRAVMAGLGMSLVVSGVARAADPSSVLGKWIERFPNGKGMVSEFGSDTIVSYPVDESGKPSEPVNKAAVSYEDLGGDLVGVQFSGASTSAIMLQRTDAESLTMDFPGVGAHKLTRLTP